MGTLNPADYFGIADAGAIAPGRKANLVVFSDLADIRAEMVFHMGRCVAEKGEMLPAVQRPEAVNVPPSMNLDASLLDFSIPAKGTRMRVIRAITDQVVTRCEIKEVKTENGLAVADVANDVIKMAVVDRYTGQARTGKGFVAGLGLKKGAIASSVAHDSHNIIVAGTDRRGYAGGCGRRSGDERRFHRDLRRQNPGHPAPARGRSHVRPAGGHRSATDGCRHRRRRGIGLSPL